jgi:hypothetical protein
MRNATKQGRGNLGQVGTGMGIDRPAIEMDLKGMRWVDLDWIQMAEDSVQCRSLINTLIIVRVA